MADVSPALVKELREKTGAGMMDCKRALDETKGNVEEAIDWLRKKGLSAAAKKSGRATAEGLVSVAVEGGKGVVIELNSETDFVAKNENFQSLAAGIAKVAVGAGGDVEKIKQAAYPGTGRNVAEEIANAIAVIGENMQLRRAAAVSVSEGVVASYIHSQVAPGLGKIGVLLGLESKGDKQKLQEVGKQIAMHIAAAKPEALNASDVKTEALEREKQVFAEQARASGKPENIIEKMVEGRIRKYYEEVVLNEQVFVLDNKTKIADVVKNAAKEAGADIKLTGFALFVLGEGVEKAQTDFAAEVAAAARG